jgi:hypothetical protein
VSAAIDEQGHYKAAGVPAGTAAVAVSSPDPRLMARRSGGKGAGDLSADDIRERKEKGTPDAQKPPPPADLSKWFAIPDQYADLATSGQTVTVKRGQNAIEIDLP